MRPSHNNARPKTKLPSQPELRLRSEARVKKIERIASGQSIRVVDLFAGCGGFSLGFARAGFSLVGAVEVDALAARSHAQNLFKHEPDSVVKRHEKPRDITGLDPKDFVAGFSSEKSDTAVDVVIGGPPCQAFARVGRAKLREIAQHPSAFLKDARSNLYLRFLHYVNNLQPLVIVLENVPDALNFGGHNVAEEICEALQDLEYDTKYTLLNSVFYGVPQMRERMFLIAYAKELSCEVVFPSPTHWIELPKGYEGSRSVALKTVSTLLMQDTFYTPPPKAGPHLRVAVSAKDAIQDLSPITLHLNGQLTRGARRFTEISPYRSDVAPSEYGRIMRSWPGFENQGGVRDHVIRSLPRDYPIFRRMKPGDQYPQAFQHAMDLFKEHLIKNQREKGTVPRPETVAFDKLRSRFVPPYDASKFPNKWRKMEPDLPARTLMAHLGKDSYSHIHYDSEQARTISVREAARLQSFPDGFVFAGTMNPAFKQIGNSVPPLLSHAIAESVRAQLENAVMRKMEECLFA